MSEIKDDKKDVDKESLILKKDSILSFNQSVLNKTSEIDTILSYHHQESIRLDIISKSSESKRFQETTQPNVNLVNELGSPKDDQIEKMTMIPSSDPTDEIHIDSISFEGRLN